MTEAGSEISRKISKGIRWKLEVAMIGMILAMVTLLTLVQMDAQRKNLIKALSTHSTFLQKDMVKRSEKSSSYMSEHIQKRIVVFDYEALQEFIHDAVKDVDNLEYVILMRSSKPVIAYGQDLSGEVRHKILSGKASSFAENQMESTRYEFTVDEHEFMETIVPIYLNKKVKWGSLRLGFSLDSLNQTLAESQRYVDEEIRNMVVRSVITSILFLIVGTILVFYLASRWTRPLRSLVTFSNEIARGDFDATAHVSTQTDDEIGLLVSSLQEMAASLKQSHGQLAEHSQTLELKVEERTRELAEAMDHAIQADKSKSEFLANMSHEIRTPINAVIGLTHLALDREEDKLQRDYLSKTLKASESLLSIINDILDFSKIEADKLDLELVDFDMDEVMHNLAGIGGVRASEKGVDFLIDCPTCMPRLKGDPYRLGQVLLNLVNNAVKFTESGQIVVSTQVQQRLDDHFVLRFEISDTGIGLNDEQKGKLFEAFSQADSSTTRKFGGTGLGLAISKQLVEMMDGEIGLESEEGEGSTFYFTATFGIGQEYTSEECALPKKLHGMQVLLVDDNEDSKAILGNYLDSFGFSVVMASTVQEAASILQAEKSVGVMLVDWTLADTKGLGSVESIRQSSGLAETPPCILAANYGQVVSDAEASVAGISATLFKPVTSASMLQAILSVFDLIQAADGGEHQAGRLPVGIIEHLRGARLLLVEDNHINQMVAEGLLAKAGISLALAHNGQEAVDAVQHDSFDGVLMDMQMPVMGGLEATRLIRRNFNSEDLPIIAMTANAMQSDVDNCLQAGMNDHVAKPIDPFDLYTKLDKWISTARLSLTGVDHSESLTAGDQAVELPDLAGVHTEEGLRRVGGDSLLYQKVLYKFADSQADVVARAQQMLASGERDQAQQLIHSLKGVAGNIGARSLFSHASDIEDLLRQGSDVAPALLEKLNEQVQRSTHAICIWRDALSSAPRQAEGVETDLDQARELLARMRSMLEEYDGDAVDLIDEIEAHLSSPDLINEVEQMRHHLNKYDFDAALNVLEQVEAKVLFNSCYRP
ncbi:two-component system, sensor histidine kinase and response regulator [Mariprofundus micogutta]|uniref:Sensory/regulatory protein RpfC n=1 Tax=Mariprofundus micogutta TaxID=1921010 RepID=A0A1L8CJY2_9PROT|nr:response regulator [Mariprofundus micogutta]GAV19228.1 two-component system, sensor histidine kinase and response regulator [Mariprofundus micogutta]